jgi:hypothetical protein
LTGAFGGLDFNNNPLICGGASHQECFSWSGLDWQVASPLNEKRGYASSCPSPYPKESHKMIVAGGSHKFAGDHLSKCYVMKFSLLQYSATFI